MSQPFTRDSALYSIPSQYNHKRIHVLPFHQFVFYFQFIDPIVMENKLYIHFIPSFS